jgi:hypothetical protein
MTESTPQETVAETPQAVESTPIETPKTEAAPEALSNLMADAKPQDAEKKEEDNALKDAKEPEEKKEESAEKELAKPEPVEYKDLKIPEGIDSEDLGLSKFVEIASQKGIPQEAAETIIAELAPQIADALKAPYQEWHKLQTEWQSQVKDDPEIGGANYNSTMTNIAKLRDNPAYCSPAFVEALKITGVGNHPEFIRTFNKIALALNEQPRLTPGAVPGSKEKKNPAETLYPNQGKT